MADELNRTQQERSPLTIWDLFSRPLASFADFSPFDGGSSAAGFKTDIVEQPDRYVLTADLPGTDKADLKLSFDDNVLTISAEHHTAREENSTGQGYVLRERVSGSYRRSFAFDNVDPEHIEAGFANGVLTVELPKQTKTGSSRSITIK